MEDMFKTFPKHNCSWLKGKITWYKNQDFWFPHLFHLGGFSVHQNYKAEPSDVLLCSCPKTGTTWLKGLAFSIVTREKFDPSTSPLLTTLTHECVPFLELDLDKIEHNHKNSTFPLVATHLPYPSLPESVLDANCKIVYIYRNTKDVVVSHYHYLREALKVPVEDSPFVEAFEEFCEGISYYGPYWDHILGYWKASLERPDRVLFLKYEDLKTDPTTNVKKLAEFIGYPFSIEEENAGVVENIVKLCSFEHLSSLEVNKSAGKLRKIVENRLYYRKAKVGDWENYFTDEMKEKIDRLMDEKLSVTGLVLK
uniref:flavonol sulfotransferase-like n=1 Tax=Erigeron canadensis TaxID=72917 RepID=UPI001CB8AA9A|nr:flavonol sulfotransferase-like [Erigeron canadensis]